MSRLKAQGWGKELEDENSIGVRLLLKADPRIRQAKPLNDRGELNMQSNVMRAGSSLCSME